MNLHLVQAFCQLSEYLSKCHCLEFHDPEKVQKSRDKLKALFQSSITDRIDKLINNLEYLESDIPCEDYDNIKGRVSDICEEVVDLRTYIETIIKDNL